MNDFSNEAAQPNLVLWLKRATRTRYWETSAVVNNFQPTIGWSKQTITMRGLLASSDAFRFSQGLDLLITKQGYSDISLDFSTAYPVRESFMVPAIALIRRYRHQGVDFDITLPDNQSGRSIFHNANWSHLINDSKFEETSFEGSAHLPASVYLTSHDQTAAVDRVMSMILKAVPINRKQLAALEWSVNEISDNVVNHSNSPLGGVIQASTFTSGTDRQFVEFVVADAGIGIMRSLNEHDNVRALERAVQEGVTRNPATNQGNGLFGTFRVATLSNGRFELHSGRASLTADGVAKVHAVKHSGAMYPGTLVVCRVGCDDEKLIENALMFKGAIHQPGFDYLEKKFEDGKVAAFNFRIIEECASFGSREAGVGARVTIENLLRADPNYPINIDFGGVSIISSSFADEVFGRLFVAMGPMAFMSRINFSGMESSVRAVLDRAISLRTSQAVTDRTI